MADEIVTIKIKINANTREIKDVNRELTKLGATSRMVDATSTKFGKTIDQKLDPAMKKYRKAIGGITSALATFNKLMLKVFGISFVVAAASLAGVNALFATGRVLVQAYRVTMQALAVGVTAAGAALATVAAAQREYNAALYAYSYRAAPAMEGGLNKSRAALRMLQTDAKLSVFGMEALNASFATLSRNGKVTGGTMKSLRTLADFAAAGGDPSKNLQAAAEFIAMMQKNGKLNDEAIAAGSEVSAAFARTLEEAKNKGIKTFDELMKRIQDGSLESANAVKGQSALLGTTIVGQFKIFGTQIQTLGADVGQGMLEPVSKALDQIFKIIRTTLVRLAPEIHAFGTGTMLEGLVNATQKLADFFVTLTRKYLPQSQGMLGRFKSFWDKTVYVFERMADAMRPLIDGGRAVIDIFGPAISGIFGKIGNIIQKVDELIVKNRDKWEKFGEAVNNVVNLLGDLIIYMIDMFDRALPIITPIINAFVDLARAVMMVGRALSSLNIVGPLGALASMAGFIGLGMATKNWAGGRGFSARPGGATAGGGAGFGGSSAAYVISGGRMGSAGGAGGWQNQGRFSAYREARGAGFSRADAREYAKTFGGPKGSIGMGAGLLASAGLGMMLPYVTGGGQTAVAAGSTLAGFAPMLGQYGLAGLGVAGGVAGLGTMLSSQTSGGGAVSGIMGGASLGATLGSVVPGIGTAAGALVGGITGGIVGFFRGGANKKKKEVSLAAKKASGELFDKMAEAMISGDVKRAEKIRTDELKRLEEGKLTAAEKKMLNKSGGALVKELTTRTRTLEVMEGPLKRFSEITDVIGTATGMTTNEIQQLANELGVNLYDDTKDAVEVMRELGVAVNLTSDQIKQSIRDIGIEALKVFDVEIEKFQATNLRDDLIVGMKEMLGAGEFDKGPILQFFRDFIENEIILRPDEVGKIYQEAFTMFGRGGTAYKQGGMFEGFEIVMAGYLEPLIPGLKSAFAGPFASLISQLFLNAGEIIDVEMLGTMFGRTDVANIDKIATILTESENFSNLDVETRRNLSNKGLATNRTDYIRQELANLGLIIPSKQTDIKTAVGLSEEETKIRQDFFNIVTSTFESAPGWMDNTPPWWDTPPRIITGSSGIVDRNKNGTAPGGSQPPVDPYLTADAAERRTGDTTSSRLMRTLSRHSSLNGMIPGSRSITSSFRTNNLGSMNSDHVTGRAYDLVGQNLGAYSRLVNMSGGFAEFHGRGGNRHLHVVPGDGPMGDTTMPSITSSNPLPNSATTNNYSITVNGGSDSPQKIARAVMEEIVRQQRSARERR